MLRTRSTLCSLICAASLVGLAVRTAHAADTAAGKTAAEQHQCATCHLPDDWKGNSDAQLQSKIATVVAGKHKHPKKIDLSKDEIDNIAAYWSAGTQ